MNDPKAILQQLQKNLNLLKEREAKYAGNAPLGLLNQITDHHTAISLTEQRLAGDISEAEWREALRPLLVAIQDVNISDSEAPPSPLSPAELAARREEYLAYLRHRLEYLDLGGIAPKVANRTVKLKMQDIFVPVQASRELDWSQGSSAAEAEKLIDTLTCQGFSIDDVFAVNLEAIPANLINEETIAAWRKLHKLLISEPLINQPASVRDIVATPRAILLGHPGTGKSTTLKYVTYAIATKSRSSKLVGETILGRLPILVRLVDYAKAQSQEATLRLRDYVRDAHDKDRAPLFRHCLEQGDCLVMLDGLDEVINPRQRTEIADQVEAFVADYPDNHYLIASRIVGYEAGRLTGDFTHFTLGSLPEESIHSFVEKWYEAIERVGSAADVKEARDRAAELFQAIQERPGIHRLAQNPLLLTIIALVNWKGRKLPNRRIEVYRYAAETLVESWPRVWRGIIFDSEEVLSLLEPVAYRLFSQRSSRMIADSELLPLLLKTVVEIKPELNGATAREYLIELLPNLSEHSGLFLEQGFDSERGERLFGFLHLTFAEYLTARHLASQWEAQKNDEKRRAFLARYAHIPRWREVVLLMVQQIGLDGRRLPATQVMADLLQLETPYEAAIHRNLLLAGQCLADDLRIEAEAAHWVLDELAVLLLKTPISPLQQRIVELIHQMGSTTYTSALIHRFLNYLNDDSATVRARAAEALGQIGSEQTVGGLLPLLNDDSPTVHLKAAEALGQIGSEQTVNDLLPLLSHHSATVRIKVAEALGRIGSEQAVDGLLSLLSHDSVTARVKAAEALGQIDSERAVDGLLSLFSDNNDHVRIRVAWALLQIDRERAVDGLLPLLNDDSPTVRARTVWTLGQIGGERAVDSLLPLLNDNSVEVCDRAARALGQIGGERAVDGLLSLLSDDSAAVRARTVEALSQLRSELAVDGLLPLLSDDSAEVRARVVEALSQLRSERAVDGLLPLLSDENAAVRVRTVEALGQIGSERTVDSLLPLFSDENVTVRVRTAWALGQIGSGRTVDGLLSLLYSAGDDVCARVVEALGQIGSERAMDDLLLLLNHHSATVRLRTAEALGRIGSERAVDNLLSLLSDDSAEVRARAAEALGQIGSERTVDSLLPLLNDDSNYTRARTAWALGRIGSERAGDGLLLLLNDDAIYVRARTAWALGQIGSEQAVDGLLLLLNDDNDTVRLRVIEALGQIGSERAVDGLLLLLSDNSATMRARTVEALGQIGSERAVDDLLLLFSDNSDDVCACVTRALSQIDNERVVDGLLSLLDHDSAIMRARAAWTLGRIGSERAVDSLIAWLSITNSYPFPDGFQTVCNWAYTTILDILGKHAPDPGEILGPFTQEPIVSGPWRKG